MLANSLAVIGLSWGLDHKKSGTEPYTDKPDGSWDRMAEEMMLQISLDPVIQYFRASSAFAEEENYEANEERKEVNTLQW